MNIDAEFSLNLVRRVKLQLLAGVGEGGRGGRTNAGGRACAEKKIKGRPTCIHIVPSDVEILISPQLQRSAKRIVRGSAIFRQSLRKRQPGAQFNRKIEKSIALEIQF